MKLDKKYAVLQIQNDGINHQVIKTTDDLGEAGFQMQMGIDLVLVEVINRDYISAEKKVEVRQIAIGQKVRVREGNKCAAKPGICKIFEVLNYGGIPLYRVDDYEGMESGYTQGVYREDFDIVNE